MTTKHSMILATCAGILMLALQREWIIVRSPSWQQEPVHQQGAEKRNTTLFFWNHDRWVQEGVEIIWAEQDIAQTLKYLIDRWLTWLDEERFIDKKISLQTAMITPNEQEVFVSFDRSPFAPDAPVHAKWYWVEGLLKTVRASGLRIQRIRFMMHHQELQDEHLDFANAWPVIGFAEKS